ncbi:MAG: 50S ribosomal protein L29 [Candidatus Woesebacteria bacterium GW2011_GWC2_47_16]|uniref:Large ribosomal subunit protein uL29 n=8 Tax=Candidatus Woeseibacteriota TaxID=1752722 RepID=A0A0G1SMX8_9BACT|nr:MAG: 50S ribosomal protein L29 [Candidatus Woesebacteria bacterium GW2011_GWE1_45_18]KKU23841.1 MAG: 50S ribosomal protein L29 [Candidatus Woesebacteria bacterium GW2011_GWF1_46_13]KKU64480.1 MAG: 50S ribosomal protein L29 [Candidatus Woesebacteria bacterium GW2011_GWC2_47_16]KKU70822.1 MAG: 50S ribosomal protein L29 [Candidatus Woesebacteria bacterium GW2011_GWD1_47_21]OGM78782.1 MAG: 50S ribosomal protein L29 [Candidatus Woesebacteria bacterium RIFOXYA1_FULL_48_16]OGM82205.1 MAG: 50S ribo
MKRKDLVDLKTKEIKDLNKILADKKAELEKVMVNIRAQKEKNLKKASHLRRDVSQVLTLISEKKILEKEVVKQ